MSIEQMRQQADDSRQDADDAKHGIGLRGMTPLVPEDPLGLCIRALRELVSEAESNLDGHSVNRHSYGFQLARAALAKIEGRA